MSRSLSHSVKAWWAAKKEDFYSLAMMASIPLLLIFAAPYCC